MFRLSPNKRPFHTVYLSPVLSALTWVGPAPVDDGLVFVLQEVLHVTHLVVSRGEVLHRHLRALLHAERKQDLLCSSHAFSGDAGAIVTIV